MFKLGVTKRTALVAEAMKRQIITPVCFVLAALIAMHSMISDDSCVVIAGRRKDGWLRCGWCAGRNVLG